MNKAEIILASASPRRKALLEQLCVEINAVKAADIDETPIKKEKPHIYAKRIAEEKADKIFRNNSGYYVIAADTVVACGSRILGKAQTKDDVRSFLKLLSGRQHSVYSAICVISPDGKKSVKCVATKVTLKSLTQQEISDYVNSDEGVGKAGGYAIQGLAGGFVKHINGSYSSVVGLPLYEVQSMLKGLGYEK